MASRILLRLIDEAVLPAIIVIVAKVVAVALLVQWLRLSWHFSTESFVPSIVFDNPEIGLFVNSYSNLFLFLVVLAGLGWVLVKAYHFHDQHASPGLVLRLLSMNLTGLLSTSNEVFHQGLVWATYLWLVMLLIGLHTVLGMNMLWVFIFAFVVTILASWLFVADVEREIT